MKWRRLFSYYAMMGLAGVLGIAKGLGLARLLGLEHFGAYGLALVAGAACQFAIGLGTVEGLNTIMPRLLTHHKNGHEPGHAIINAARMIWLRTTLLGCLLWPALFVLQPPHYQILLYAPLLGLSNALTTIPMVHARAAGDLMAYGRSMALKALGTLGLSYAGAYAWGADGALLGEFLGALIAMRLAWPAYRSGPPLAWRDTLRADREARRAGWPLMVQGANGIAQQNIERWSVAGALGLEGAGRYGLAQLFVTSINLVHATFFQQSGAHILPKLAEGARPREALRHVIRFGCTLGLASLMALAVALTLGHGLIAHLIPGESDLTWGLVWLMGAAVAQLMHHSDWILIGCRRPQWIERISWLITVLTAIMFGAGLLCHASLAYFLFSYFLGRVALLSTSLTVAWKTVIDLDRRANTLPI